MWLSQRAWTSASSESIGSTASCTRSQSQHKRNVCWDGLSVLKRCAYWSPLSDFVYCFDHQDSFGSQYCPTKGLTWCSCKDEIVSKYLTKLGGLAFYTVCSGAENSVKVCVTRGVKPVGSAAGFLRLAIAQDSSVGLGKSR